MKMIKYLGAIVVAALLLFVFVANFSSVETRFECTGETASQKGSQRTTVFVKLAKYRWWVGLWSDSSGHMWLEIPNNTFEYIENIKEVGYQLQLYDFKNNIKGHFSTLSKTLALKVDSGFFDGTCKRIDP